MAGCGAAEAGYPQSFPQIVWMGGQVDEGGPAASLQRRKKADARRSRRVARSPPPAIVRRPERAASQAIIRPVRPRAFSHVEGVDLLKIVQEAGWPIWPLILCSIAAVALIVERFMALRTARIAPGYLLGEVIAVTRNGLPPQDVIAKLADNSLLGSVLASGLKLLSVDPRVFARIGEYDVPCADYRG